MKILGLMISAGLILVILGIVLAIGAKITGDVRDDMETGSYAYNASDESTQAIGSLAEWEGTIATVIAAVVIIGLLMAGFGAFLMVRGEGV